MIKISRSRRRLSRLAAVAIPAEPPPTITISGDSRLACADVLDMFRSLSLPRALLMSADALHADPKFRLIPGFRWAGIDAPYAGHQPTSAVSSGTRPIKPSHFELLVTNIGIESRAKPATIRTRRAYRNSS